MNLSAQECENAAFKRLAAVRAQYDAALAAKDVAAATFHALDTDLYVDQIRFIVAMISAPFQWTVRDGKRSIDTKLPLGRDFLGWFVGKDRVLAVDDVVQILTDIVTGRRIRAMEMQVARFANLLVVEPYHHPDKELCIWLNIARLVASGAGERDAHEGMPALITDFDALHEELTPSSPYAANLLPQEGQPRPSVRQCMKRLLSEIRPDLMAILSNSTTTEELDALIASHSEEMRQYIRSTIFERIARTLAGP